MITMSSFKYAGLIISIIISLISCTHNKNYPTAFQPELAKAEAMMYRYPDSALHILQGIQPDIPSENALAIYMKEKAMYVWLSDSSAL